MEGKRDGCPVRVKACLCAFTVVAAAVGLGCAFAGAGLPDTVARPLTAGEQAEIIDRNSPLVDYVYLSPNADFPRDDSIRKITVHHMGDDLGLDSLGYSFAERDRNASSNYAIDVDGNIALYVEESNRAWTSSSPWNDGQAVTIEVANDEAGGDWHVSDESFDALVDLCVDICRRNGMNGLDWTGGQDGTLTVHSMFFDETDCPGPYLLSCMPDLAALVNEELAGKGRFAGQDGAGPGAASASVRRPLDPSKPMVALTFDDGPDAVWTDAILDVLEENGAAATFFVIGEHAEAYPETVARMDKIGCEVGNHGYDSGLLTDLDVDGLIGNLDAADEAIVAAGAPWPELLRAPGGHVDHRVRRNAGKAVVGWTIDPRDWEIRDARKTVDYVKSRRDLDGGVILLHSVYESSVDAAVELVPWLLDRGYQLVTVSELLEQRYDESPKTGVYYGNRYFTTRQQAAMSGR